MSLLKPAPVSTVQFRFDRATGTFHADLSDLGRDFRFGRVYDDACDVGITLVSERTGREIVFAIVREQRDGEGELQFVDLTPAYGQGFRPELTVRLYND